MSRFLPLAWVACFFLVPAAPAADLTQFVNEVYRFRHNENVDTIAYWLPAEYWDELWKDSPYMSDEDRHRLVAVLKQYTIVAVTSTRTYSRTVQPRTRAELVKTLELRQNGEPFTPLDYAELPEEVQNLVGRLKPMVENVLGQAGKGTEFFVFTNAGIDHPILDPRRPGTLQLMLDEAAFEWRLPLAVLFPPKIDPKTGESFPGTYNFNPYTGDRLPAAAPASPAAK